MTAYLTGTVTGAQALFNKLIDELKNNADLGAANQQWQEVWANASGTEKVLKGPGLAAADSIYVGLKFDDSLPGTNEQIFIYGMTDIDPAATVITNHVNVQPYAPRCLYESNVTITYWMHLTGRRFVMATKISTVYQGMYGGFFLPYAHPSAYPYPLFIGACAPEDDDRIDNWADTPVTFRNFTHSSRDANYDVNNHYGATAYFMDPSNTWHPLINAFFLETDLDERQYGYVNWQGSDYAKEWWDDDDRMHPTQVLKACRQAYGASGGHPLYDLIIGDRDGHQCYGTLDGVFSAPGYNLVAETILTATEDATPVDHIVFPNVFRSGDYHLWAMRAQQ